MGNGLIWYRNDLRTKDHEALKTACDNHNKVIAIYCFDPRHYTKTKFGFLKTGKFRARFLIETVLQLRDNLHQLNIPLLIFQKKPELVIPEIVRKYEIDSVYFQKEWTQEELEVESNIRQAAADTSFYSFYQQFLFQPEDIPYKSFSDIPR
ncbi:MAG: deoxyribodipyrimidine photo-lyase, partial [Gramella sp.]|nr:deoxyribodipyrimidine photo-lyase [Christiangramia sp.]